MDEHTKCRLLSSVYQPFVNLAPALLFELEQFLGRLRQQDGHFDDVYTLLKVLDLLARLLVDVKVSLDDEKRPRNDGWPLCTRRYVVCHLCDPLVSDDTTTEHRFEIGDFYYSIIPVKDHRDEITFRFATYDYDVTEGVFRPVPLERNDFLTFLCDSKSIGGERLFRRRCVVRNGINSVVELVSWEQLYAYQDRNCDVFTSRIMPLLDFIDGDSFLSHSRGNDSEPSSTRCQTREECEIGNTSIRNASLCLTFSNTSSPCTTNRMAKRIGDIRVEFLSDGYLSFTGGRFRANERYAIVEIRPAIGKNSLVLDEHTVGDFVNALLYLYSIHRRHVQRSKIDGRDFGLVLVVGVAKVEENGGVDSNYNWIFLRWFREVLRSFMQHVPNGLERIVFVDQCVETIGALFSNMQMENATVDTQKRVVTVKESELQEQVVSSSELSDTFGGTITYDRKRWVTFRQDVERFMHSCQTVAKDCVSALQTLKSDYCESKMTSFWSFDNDGLKKEIERLKQHQAELESQEALALERNGDEDLRRLRETYEDLKQVPSHRDAVEKVAALYDEVRKAIVNVSDRIHRRIGLLETYVKAKKLIDKNEQLTNTVGHILASLKSFSTTTESGGNVKNALKQFETFYNETVQISLTEANVALNDRLTDEELTLLVDEQKDTLLSSIASLRRIHDAVTDAANFVLRRLRNLVLCHSFLDQAYDWALDSRDILNRLAHANISPSKGPSDELRSLLSYLETHPPISPSLFNENVRIASEAGDEKLVIQCKVAQERCLYTERALFNWVKILEQMVVEQEENVNGPECASSETASSSLESDRDRANLEIQPSIHRRRPCSLHSASSLRSSQSMLETVELDLISKESGTANEKTDFNGIITEDLTETVVSEISEKTLRKMRVERSVAHNPDVNGSRKSSLLTPPLPSADFLKSTDKSKLRRPFRKLMKRSSTCDEIVLNAKPTRHQSLESIPSISEESVDGGATKSVPLFDANRKEDSLTGTEVDEDQGEMADIAPPFPAPIPPSILNCMTSDRKIPSPPPDCSPNIRMQHMVVNELLLTEEAYVASLQYVIEHYLSEMHRNDLPHQLLGQRLTIFGNIEKIFDFHVGQFLPELKRNCSEASDVLGAQVAKCFIEYRSKFHLYALYNKNKPKSDALMAECAGIFFRTKQLLLRDKLDLSSYLLKPVQRMGKYALMLQQLIKACPSCDQEQLETLKAAEEMVTFQLRHGNDLLAMDSIQKCDMNLKEQGQLLRQDEFVVFQGRTSHKCVRRVFLFEQLVLFTKPRRIRGTNGAEKEIYETKRCLKMSDIGMTEQVGDSDLKFELWFLRHTSGQRFVLQARLNSIRQAWVSCIRKILWHQALSNREMRKAETSSMGGNVCVDLKPSKDRIEDRALNASLLMKAQPKMLPILAHSATCDDFTGSQSKRPHSLISVDSSTSSSNVSSSTGSTGSSRLGVKSVLERTIGTSSESGICDYSRSDTRSYCADDECLSTCSRPMLDEDKSQDHPEKVECSSSKSTT